MRVRSTLVAVLILFPAVAAAQLVSGSIQGRVTDASGAVVAGAQVQVTNDGTGFKASTRTDDRGWYLVGALQPGDYRVEVSQDRFRRHTQPVVLAVNQDRRLDIVLQPGSMSEVVTVTADTPGLDRTTTSLVTRISPERLVNLPLDGRNFLELSLLAPGAVPASSGSAGSVRGDFAFNVNGAREDANMFWLDGAYNFDPKLNGVAVRPPIDAIREFEVITSTPDASLGRAGGAHVNVVSRSGTNMLRGTAYEFLRTGAFNARNYFAPENEPAPEYTRHQFGGSVGGAIKPSRIFFFGDYEGTRLNEGITRVTNVPTLEERVGNFTNSLFAPPRNPLTGETITELVPQFLNPIGLAIAGLYPRPNREVPFANYVSSPELDDDVDQFDGRVDVAGDGATTTVRYSFSDRRLFEPFAGPSFAAVPGFGTNVPRRAQNFGVSDHRSLGARFVNEGRVAWTRVAIGVFHEGQGTSLNQQVGLPELSANPRDWGLSFITVSGFSPLGDEFNNPQEGITNHWQFSDVVTWIAGAHALKAGGEIRTVSQEAYRDVQSRGQLQFTSQAFTGNALADLLVGLPTVTVGAVLDNPQNLRTHSYALFLQDSFQASPTLTLTAGLRYEFNSPPVDADDRVSLYDPASGTVVPVGQDGMPRSGVDPDRNNFAPRLGASWAARPDTVVRGGYGISYDQAALAPNEFLYFNPPYFDLSLYFSVPQVNYLLTLFDPFPADFPFPLPKSATAVQRDLRTPYWHQWHAGVQHQLTDTRTVEVGYVGSRGRNLIAARDLNQPAPSPVMPNLRPNPMFADITVIESRARSTYDALQLRFDQRLDRGLNFTATYTLGSAEDDASGFFSSAGDANFPMDSNNPEGEWGRSNFDVRHRFTLHGGWQLPFGPGRRWLREGFWATCLGNWDLYGVMMLESGRPFTVAIHPDIDNSNTGRANLGFGANDRPSLAGNPDLPNPTATRWFNTDAFTFPQFGTFGDVGRNTLEGPGFSTVNLAFARDMQFDRGRLQFRLELFNLFNAENFGLPDNFLGSPTFGQILTAGAPRRMQLGVRFMY